MSRIDATGRIIAGKYELVVPAGEGGMAVVWKAIARGAGAFQRQVAIKRIQAGRHHDPSFIKMFEEEARVGSQLQHPNIIQILDFGRDEDGGYYLVMEWCEGLDMFQWVRSHPKAELRTPWPLVAAVGIETLRGLAAAHERELDNGPAPVIHRDVSPSNIMLGTNGTVKLMDFGLARATDRASMTRPNVLKGKLAYTAPELISGAKASPRTDVFSLGVVLWEALAQRRLFSGKNDLEVLVAVRKGDVPPLTGERPDIPAALAEIIGESLAADPERRFQTAKEMARTLAAVLRSSTEAADAEPLGASVRSARQRLGKDSSEAPAPGPGPEPVMSSENLSVSDVEMMDPAAAAPAPASSDPPKGLFNNDGLSGAVPLTRKK